MTAPHGLWAVLGNHDAETDPIFVTRALQAESIHVLANQSVAIERDGARIWLTGVNDVISGGADLAHALRGVPSDEAVILLAHEPDFADAASTFPIDLQLSGHSHGGQVRLPLLPPLYLPEMAKKYVLGSYQVGRARSLYECRPGNCGHSGPLELPARDYPADAPILSKPFCGLRCANAFTQVNNLRHRLPVKD